MAQKKELTTISGYARKKGVDRNSVYYRINVGDIVVEEIAGQPFINWTIYGHVEFRAANGALATKR